MADNETKEGNSVDGPEVLGAKTSRRRIIAGMGAAAAGGAVAVATLSRNGGGEQGGDTKVVAKKVGQVPTNPEDEAWNKAPRQSITMDSQKMVLPYKLTAMLKAIEVRALHDGSSIGFRLSWKDTEANDLTIAVDGFRDACAVMLAPAGAPPGVRVMGTVDQPATILHWKADWQRDVDQGFQELEVEFPRATADFHPPIAPTPEPERHVTVTDYIDREVTWWLPGIHAQNPVSNPRKTVPVEKMLAKGPGTLATTDTQDATGKGVRTDDGWAVTIVKPLTATEEGEPTLEAGGDAAVAVALWSGTDNDSGGHKTPSLELLTLHLE